MPYPCPNRLPNLTAQFTPEPDPVDVVNWIYAAHLRKRHHPSNHVRIHSTSFEVQNACSPPDRKDKDAESKSQTKESYNLLYYSIDSKWWQFRSSGLLSYAKLQKISNRNNRTPYCIPWRQRCCLWSVIASLWTTLGFCRHGTCRRQCDWANTSFNFTHTTCPPATSRVGTQSRNSWRNFPVSYLLRKHIPVPVLGDTFGLLCGRGGR